MHRFKMGYKVLPLVIVLLLTLLCSKTVYADDTSLGRTPDGVFPMQENDVIMEAEEITVDLEKNSVECIFVFHNTGKSKNVYMGFPGKLYHDLEDGLTNEVNLELSSFKTFVKGKEVPVTREKGMQSKVGNLDESDGSAISDTLVSAIKSKYSEFFTFTIPFNADEKVTVRNTYTFNPTYDSMGEVYSGYVLKTGAMWKGPIGSAKVTFKLGKIQPYQLGRIKPSGFKFVGNNLIWERKNFEPTYDLQLSHNTWHYSKEFLEGLTADEKTGIEQKINDYIKARKLIKEAKKLKEVHSTEELLVLYKKAIEKNDSVLALYIGSYLPSDRIPKQSITLGNISVNKANNGETDKYYIGYDTLGTEVVNIQLSISHVENGNKVVDTKVNDEYSVYSSLLPGVEYTITYTIKDWMDNAQQKTLVYKVPGQIQVPPDSEAQSSASDGTATSSDSSIVSQTSNISEDKPVSASVNESSVEEVNTLANEQAKDKNDNSLKLIILAIAGVVLIGVLVVSIVVLRKNQR